MDIRVNKLRNKIWELPLLCKLSRQLTTLVRGRNLASQKKPEHALGCHLFATRCRGKHLLAVWDSQAMKTDALDITLVESPVGQGFTNLIRI